MARTIRNEKFSSYNRSNRVRDGRRFAGRNRRQRYALRNELPTLETSLRGEMLPVVAPVNVPTFNVFRYGQDYIRVTGRTDLHPYRAAGYVNLPASELRADDFVDGYYAKMLERAEDYEGMTRQWADAEAHLAQLREVESAMCA